FLIEESAKNKDARKTLERFVEQYLSASKPAGWFPKKKIFDVIVRLYEVSNIYGMAFNQGKDDYGVVIKLKKEIFQKIEELSAGIPEGQNKNTTNKIKKVMEKRNEYFQLGDLPYFYKYPEPPMNKGYVAPDEYIKKWRGIIPLTERLSELEAITKYPVYVNLFNLILEQFSMIAGKEDVLFLSELNRKAADIISNEKVGIAELYYRLATRFKHYLLDEFQDTSELQWRNLELMIDDALASGGSLFYVGDRKQAIFRFRGGEPRLFKQVADDFKHYNVKYKLLTQNQRSQKAIVEFNNWVFAEENLKRLINRVCAKKEIADDGLFETSILDIYSTDKQDYLKEKEQGYGYVRVDYLIGDDRESSEEKVKKQLMATIRQLKKRFEYGDIAILDRDNKTVELITNWLLDEKLPAESERTLNVLKNRLILEIISLLKFIQSPIDELNFGGFILGEIFAKVTGIKQQEIRDYLFELETIKISGKGNLYIKFRDKYPKIWEEYIEWFFKSAGFISPYELIISIYQRFRVMANFPENQAFFVKFLDFIKSAEDEYIDLDELLAYLTEQSEKRESKVYVSAPQSNSIKVQTIHKSKGLEFPVVIIPFLEPDISRENPFISRNADGMDLLHITQEHTLYSENIRRIYNNDYLNNLVDELNSIYVALTRAKSELYVFIPGSQNKDGEYSNYAFYLIPKGEAEYIERGKQTIYQKSAKPEHSEIKAIALSKYQDWLKLLREETGNAGLFRNRNKIIEGNVMHFLLANMPNCTAMDISVLIKESIENAKSNFPFLRNFSDYQSKLTQILKHPDFKPFFYVEDGSVYCEKEFVNKYGDSRRIDRLIITNNEAVIVDYKSTGDFPADGLREEYQKQVTEYAEIVSTVYPGRKVKAYIIFLDTLKTEAVKINYG
ncbi:MAG: 3'-5' exonuclease, partial [Planctomycetota bacterium]